MATAASVLTRPTFKLADRLKIQQEIISRRDYTIIGKLSAVLFEAQRSTVGLSQSRPRWQNAKQADNTPDTLAPFSERQTVLWASTVLDWLGHAEAPMLALSRDKQDLLLPFGMNPLPPIPDPRWTPGHARQACPNSKNGCKGCNPPRIPQRLTGCPVVGNRVDKKITDRDGKVYGVVTPLVELSVIVNGIDSSGFVKIRCGVSPMDSSHMALLIDDSGEAMRGYFVGGQYQFGG